MIKIAIIIPTFNRAKKLEIIISQLQDQMTSDDLIGIEIIVVVDGSSDGTIGMLENKFPSVHIINGNGNWWYTKSMNEGFKCAQKFKPDFVLTLNDDVEINPEYISKLLDDYKSLKEQDVVLGSMSISNSDDNPLILFAGVKNHLRAGLKSEHYIEPLQKSYSSEIKGIHKTMELPGRGILIPNTVLKELGYFDEEFPQYGSDTDFCFRARKKGIRIYISWNAVVKVNLQETRIRSQSGENTYYLKIRDLFDIHSHQNIFKFIKFHKRHYNCIHLVWKLPYFLILNFKS
ncbi:glycosyltransferase family 2 protein [Gracilimonas sediminicola]|uniref:glycosyltransferase family 2 protein n=1 Tax=Gracilimonas sediminicola TaxID=2952158 RepID=UPI0038D4CB17